MSNLPRRVRTIGRLAFALTAFVACADADPSADAVPSVSATPGSSTPSTVATADADADADAASRPQPPAAVPTTTVPAPVPSPTFTLAPEPEPLPQPVPPPVDDTASEPVVPLGSVAIPALGIDRPLFDGIRLPTFDMGPGHWPGTALPGQIGNMVIGGHRTEGNADFADIDRLQPGDEVIVTDMAGSPFTYLVRSVEITDPFAERIVYQTAAPTATLFACHPPGSVAQRVVVHLDLLA